MTDNDRLTKTTRSATYSGAVFHIMFFNVDHVWDSLNLLLMRQFRCTLSNQILVCVSPCVVDVELHVRVSTTNIIRATHSLYQCECVCKHQHACTHYICLPCEECIVELLESMQVSLVDYLMYAMEVMMNIMANVNKSIRHTDDIKNDCCIAELLS